MVRNDLVGKVFSGTKKAVAVGAIGLVSLMQGCDTASENALFSAMAGANANLAGQQGDYRRATAWQGLANASGTLAQQQSAMESARAGRSQVNVYNGNKGSNNSEDEEYIVVYNSRTGKNEKWVEISPEKFKKDLGIPQEASAKMYDTDTFKKGLSNLTVVVSYNYWVDLDGSGDMLKRDETIDYDELVGLGKHQFRSDERITFLFLHNENNSDKINYKLIGDGGRILTNWSLPVGTSGYNFKYNYPDGTALGRGNYVVSWDVDGKGINSWKFEVID